MAEELTIAKLSKEHLEDLKTLLKRRTAELKEGLKELFEVKLPNMRKAYDAKPYEETRQFPFQNASNLVAPIIAIHVDTLHARLMSAIFKTQPLYVAKLFGEFGSVAEDLREAYQEFLQYVGLEPQELDLYRVYNEGLNECIKYGTVTFKSPWEKKIRDFLIPGGDGSGSKQDFLHETIYEGPRPEKLPFDSFYLPPMAKTLETADIKCHKRTMLRHQLEERKFTEVYEKDIVDEVLKTPDRQAPSSNQKDKEQAAGVKTIVGYGHQEWDIWECYLEWRIDGGPFAPRIIATYHPLSNQILRVMYDNFRSEWFVGARLLQCDDMYHGDGFAKILWPFQEEASQIHNGRRDNQTVANTRVWRVSPDSKLNQGYRIYPSAMLPAEPGEIEPLAHGELSQINIDEERLTLELAERRSGVSPPQQGFGAGTMSGKRGVYSAMGTLSMLQEGNRRTDVTISDVRDAHVRLGRLVSLQYAVFGKGTPAQEARLKLFGKKAPLIEKALEKIASREMGLPVYAATASVNKEVEKQNDIMLSQIMAKHYQMVAQLLGSVQNMMTPPQVKEYFVEVIRASNTLMKTILRNFGHDEVERLVPDPLKMEGAQLNGPKQNSGTPQQAPPMAGGSGGPAIQ